LLSIFNIYFFPRSILNSVFIDIFQAVIELSDLWCPVPFTRTPYYSDQVSDLLNRLLVVQASSVNCWRFGISIEVFDFLDGITRLEELPTVP
jgi:hypothetical protein